MSLFTVIIPTYRTPQMTAYTVSKLLEYSKEGQIDIVVVNNYPEDNQDTWKHLLPFMRYIRLMNYPECKLQSHGIAMDWAIGRGLVKGDYFMVLESDSFPINNEWIPFYEKLIKAKVDAAGSMLKLSGGLYLHPNGAIYSMKVYNECKEYCKGIEYEYFPNMNRVGDFDYHTMIHRSVLDRVLDNPNDCFELAEGYKPYSKEKALERLEYYRPTTGVFHNGVGNLDESTQSYGQRGWDTMRADLPLTNKKKIIRRVGFEPGQFFYYWLEVNGKKIHSIPTEVKWMEGREGQQQEYTLSESGIKHLWGISSYTERSSEGVEDIYEAKRRLPNELYETLPENQKVKL